MEELYKSGELVIDVFAEDFEPAPECCIYEVPNRFREGNANAFIPELVCIGPFYFGKQQYAEMEKRKKRYLKKFCRRFSDDKNILEKMVRFLREEENVIRNRYSKSFSDQLTDSDLFIKMILYDAVFIIELFLRDYENDDNDLILNKTSLNAITKKDLILLENQIPFFVLERLYVLALSPPPSGKPMSFLQLACDYFEYYHSMTIFNEQKMEHFTDLRRWALAAQHPPCSSVDRMWTSELCSATMLHDAGVEFKAAPAPDRCLLDVNFDKKHLIMPSFLVSTHFGYYTRNIIAFEQCPWFDGTAGMEPEQCLLFRRSMRERRVLRRCHETGENRPERRSVAI